MNCVSVTPVPQHEARWYKNFMFRGFETLTHSSRLFSPPVSSSHLCCRAGVYYVFGLYPRRCRRQVDRIRRLAPTSQPGPDAQADVLAVNREPDISP